MVAGRDARARARADLRLPGARGARAARAHTHGAFWRFQVVTLAGGAVHSSSTSCAHAHVTIVTMMTMMHDRFFCVCLGVANHPNDENSGGSRLEF